MEVIVSLYADVQSIKSSRLSSVFGKLLELPPQSRVSVTKSVLKLNREMECLSQLITDADGNRPKLGCLEEDAEDVFCFVTASNDIERVMKAIFATTAQAAAAMVGISEQDQYTLLLDQQTTCIETSSVQVLWNLMNEVGANEKTASSFLIDSACTTNTPAESLEEYADTLSDWMTSFVAAVRDDCASQFIDLVGFESDSQRTDARSQLNRLGLSSSELPANLERWNELKEVCHNLCIKVLEANHEETWCPPVQQDQLDQCMVRMWSHLELDSMVAHTKVFCQQMSAVCTRAQEDNYTGPTVVVNRRVPVRQAHCSCYPQIFLKRTYAASANDISEKDEDTPFYWGLRIHNAMKTMTTMSNTNIRRVQCELNITDSNITDPVSNQELDPHELVTFGDGGHNDINVATDENSFVHSFPRVPVA